MNKDELRVIPKKNYIILGVVIIVTLLILYYFLMWIDAYNETKLNKPILNKYMEVINYNELSDYLVENPDTIIYVSVLEDKEIREFEKKVKVLFKKHEIDKEILYMDITNDLNNKEIKNEMINKYNFGNYNMTNVPLVIVFENGIVKNIFSASNNEYNIDSFKTFINDTTFTSEGDIDG